MYLLWAEMETDIKHRQTVYEVHIYSAVVSISIFSLILRN